MRKLIWLAIFLAGAMMCLSPAVYAQTSSAAYDISVTIDNASTATFVVYQIDAGVFTAWTDTTLSFNPVLTDVREDPADPPAYAYLGDVYYAIDVFPYGAGALNVTLSYSNADPAYDLGVHAIGTPVSNDDNGTPTIYTDDTETPVGVKAILNSIAQTIYASDILANGDYLRFYVGLATGDPTENEPSGAVPFNPGDTPGHYEGTLTMTVAAPGP